MGLPDYYIRIFPLSHMRALTDIQAQILAR